MKKNKKEIKRELRKLAGLSWQRELDSYISELYDEFEKWKNGKIDCFELNEKIHKFHQGPSREVWKYYANEKPDSVVARAIAEGTIKENEVSKEILNIVEDRVKFIKEMIEK